MAEMKSRMSAREYNGWMAQYEISPFGPEAEEMRLARLMALLANINRDKNERKDPFTADDFILESMKQSTGKDEEERTEEDEIALAKKIASVFGLKIPGV